jgi:hypothetical protein
VVRVLAAAEPYWWELGSVQRPEAVSAAFALLAGVALGASVLTWALLRRR